MAELKPCPFCGSKRINVVPSIGWLNKTTVFCADCNASTDAYEKTPERFELIEGDIYRRIPEVPAERNAINAWNRRASDG